MAGDPKQPAKPTQNPFHQSPHLPQLNHLLSLILYAHLLAAQLSQQQLQLGSRHMGQMPCSLQKQLRPEQVRLLSQWWRLGQLLKKLLLTLRIMKLPQSMRRSCLGLLANPNQLLHLANASMVRNQCASATWSCILVSVALLTHVISVLGMCTDCNMMRAVLSCP